MHISHARGEGGDHRKNVFIGQALIGGVRFRIVMDEWKDTHPVNASVIASGSLRSLCLLGHVLDAKLAAGKTELSDLIRPSGVAMSVYTREVKK